MNITNFVRIEFYVKGHKYGGPGGIASAMCKFSLKRLQEDGEAVESSCRHGVVTLFVERGDKSAVLSILGQLGVKS